MNKITENNKTCRNIYIDLFKVLMAFFVVVLHYDFSPFTRIAVPFFFMIDGFFAYNNKSYEEKLTRAKKRIIDCIKYLLIGFAIYFIYDIICIICNGTSFQNYVINLLSRNIIIDLFVLNKPLTSGFHLWFLWALLVVNILQYILVKYNKTNIHKFLFLPLIIFNLLLTVYLKNTPVFLTELELTRNAILFGLPLFEIGFKIGEKQTEISRINIIILSVLAILFFGLQFLENYLYATLLDVEHAEFFICSLISSALFVCVLTNIKTSPKALNLFYKIFGKHYAFYLYIIHIATASIITSATSLVGFRLVVVSIVVSTCIYLFCRWIIIYIKNLVK